MFYIHHISCVSPQQTFSNTNINTLQLSHENKLIALEPTYEGIPNNVLRRMGKAVRLCVGASLPLLKTNVTIDGIIIGTANGGMEDCIKFMNQIIQYDEGMLTPGNFVQSTPNGLAAQIALLKHNTGYNITHVHRGLSFENAVIDAGLMLKDHPTNTYLLGAADEISTYNYNVDSLGGWYKKEIVSNTELYTSVSPASIAGEGAVMLLVNTEKKDSILCLIAVHTSHSEDLKDISTALDEFLKINLQKNEELDILIHGENGDSRFLMFYEMAEKKAENATVLRFKHMCGEYPTASAQALWLACELSKNNNLPTHALKKKGSHLKNKNILIYNNYKGVQHSFMLLSKNS